MGGNSIGVGGIGIGIWVEEENLMEVDMGDDDENGGMTSWIIRGSATVPLSLPLLLLIEEEDDLIRVLNRGVRIRGEDLTEKELRLRPRGTGKVGVEV